MHFRIEEKIRLHISDLLKIKNFILESNGSELFPERKIESVYFDNKSLMMYADSEEGVLPRKKIRIRNYPENKVREFFLEKKISSIEGKYKKSRKINVEELNTKIKNGIFDKEYGKCFKNLKVSYNRKYYQLDDIRITLDYNILYNSVNDKRTLHDKETLILEVKTNKNQKVDFDNLLKIIPFNRVRYSKYCEGIKNLFYQNHSPRLII